MTTLVIRTDTMSHARELSAELKRKKFVKSVDVFNEPALSQSDWIKPGRPATEKEIEKMMKEAEDSPSIVAEAAAEYSAKLITKD